MLVLAFAGRDELLAGAGASHAVSYDSPRVDYDTADSQGFELTKQVLHDALSACEALEQAIELKVLAAGGHGAARAS
ncbi:hypothetical protein KFE25_005187 [Diacronema lutheri]|uniref:Uncharacterized protein n=1 Tax=Diacronema lutheri TaxID=2081491 RepID=A0A8J5X8C4_DIALT|nr:hypothetical protein KFE25_005187 [Diacronema lutheri]